MTQPLHETIQWSAQSHLARFSCVLTKPTIRTLDNPQKMYVLGPDGVSSASATVSLQWLLLFGRKRERSVSGDRELSSRFLDDFRAMGPVRLCSTEHRASPQSKRVHGCRLSVFRCAVLAYFVTISVHVAVGSSWSIRAVWRVTNMLSGFRLWISPLNL